MQHQNCFWFRDWRNEKICKEFASINENYLTNNDTNFLIDLLLFYSLLHYVSVVGVGFYVYILTPHSGGVWCLYVEVDLEFGEEYTIH